MQPKILIIIAVVGIVALAIFNMTLSHRGETAKVEAKKSEPIKPTTTANTSLGIQPKATMDKATSQINQANVETNAKMAEADNAGGK